MKKIGLAIPFSLMISATAVAAEETSYYGGYFDVSTITDLTTQVALYNEENGYWENEQIINRELRRYLLSQEIIKQSDESNLLDLI